MKTTTKKATKAAPKKVAIKKAKPAPKYENEGRAFILIQQAEGNITNTQVHGSMLELVTIVATSLQNDNELRTILSMALAFTKKVI